ncbi:unnamed protein product [Polarella glacialis]|uniref:Uncharacterized protein n=1 Tax=Polarella glacialis TaxID=89957 RepID=A0A813FTK9_POLGL|nr:unnamed protein product [Polarella glacialis]
MLSSSTAGSTMPAAARFQDPRDALDLELDGLGLPTRENAKLGDCALLVLGLSHALAGHPPASLAKGALERAAREQIVLAAKVLSASGSAELPAQASLGPSAAFHDDSLASCSQLVTGLQCLSFWGGRPLRAHSILEVKAQQAVLLVAQPPLVDRGSKPRREGTLGGEVLDILEGVLASSARLNLSQTSGRGLPVIRTEEPVTQFFVDILVFNPSAANKSSNPS